MHTLNLRKLYSFNEEINSVKKRIEIVSVRKKYAIHSRSKQNGIRTIFKTVRIRTPSKKVWHSCAFFKCTETARV